MAAYAALVALMDTIRDVHNHPHLSNCLDNINVEILSQTVDFLQRFLEGYSHEAPNMEKIIAVAASGVDDLIRYLVADQNLNTEIVGTDSGVARKLHADLLIRSYLENVISYIAAHDSLLPTRIYTPAKSFPHRILGRVRRYMTCSKPEKTPSLKHVDSSISESTESTSSVPTKTTSSVPTGTTGSEPVLTSNSSSKPVENSKSLLIYLGVLIEHLGSIRRRAINIQVRTTVVNDPNSKSVATSTSIRTGKTVTVGLEDEVIGLMDRLSAGQSSRQVSSITGMGGIGKTTLARCVFEKPFIVHHFDIRIWITISQEITIRDVLLQIPICQKENEDNQHSLTDDQLGDVLFKSLAGKRYLIVMDDMWDIQTWYDLKGFFPDNATESRILVTTRLSSLSRQFGSSPLEMTLLDHKNSWELFCEKAFGQEGCRQAEFEDIGKKIVQKCGGLPLTIVVIGGLLATHKTPEYWEVVASDMRSVLHSSDYQKNCMDILSLSYNHLRTHLKPCFLYFGIFPKDHKIRVSHIIQLWIAEGFLKPNEDRSLEGVAEAYLKDLIDRNLVSVHEWGLNGKIKACYIHDVLRDLCLMMAQRDEFIDVPESRSHLDMSRLAMVRRIAAHNENAKEYRLLQFASTVMGIKILESRTNLLRVLDTIKVESLQQVFQHINLRYVGCHLMSRAMIPPSIALLWNLQSIRCDNIYLTFAPIEIWRMEQLCHIQFSELFLPDPPSGHTDDCILRNLQTLMTIVNFKCTEEVLRRIPCIKKLKIKYEEPHGESMTKPYFGLLSDKEFHGGSYYGLHNLHHLSKLESLHVYFYIKQSMKRDLQRCLTYPSSLKKLALDTTIELCWDDLEIMGRLPHLEALKLNGSIAGHTWNPSEGEFCSLKSLNISAYIELISWNTDESHFPVLEILDLGNAPQLDGIPEHIGDISSLKLICLGGCRASAAISTLNILVEQESFGNEGLEVKVSFINSAEEENFQEMAELEGLASNKFLVQSGKW